MSPGLCIPQGAELLSLAVSGHALVSIVLICPLTQSNTLAALFGI